MATALPRGVRTQSVGAGVWPSASPASGRTRVLVARLCRYRWREAGGQPEGQAEARLRPGAWQRPSAGRRSASTRIPSSVRCAPERGVACHRIYTCRPPCPVGPWRDHYFSTPDRVVPQARRRSSCSDLGL